MPEGALTSFTVYNAYRYFVGQTVIDVVSHAEKFNTNG